MTSKRKLSTFKTTTKPYPEFPLFPHQNGQWAKTIEGSTYYFGAVSEDYRKALKRYCEVRDSIKAGRKIPRKITGGEGFSVSVCDLMDSFLAARDKDVENGTLRKASWNEYLRTARRIVDCLEKDTPLAELTPESFQELRQSFTKGLNATSQRNEVARARVIFNYAFDSGLIDMPLRFKKMLRAPSSRELRAAQSKRPRLLDARDVRLLIESARGYMKPAILLAVNCGLGNRDVALLEMQHLDLKEGWLFYPRPKTGVDRQAKLWPETIKAIQEFWGLFESRPIERDARALCRDSGQAIEALNLPLTHDFRRLVRRSGIPKQFSFYALRHTFRTIADDSGDQPAIAKVMGHAMQSIDAVYRHRITDTRLEKVSSVVREWLLFGKGVEDDKEKTGGRVTA